MHKTLREILVTKQFAKGIVLDVVLFFVSIGAITWAALRIPMTTDGYDDRVSAAAFVMMGIVAIVSALFIRSITLLCFKQDRSDNTSTERAIRVTALALLLPVIAYVILLPWVFAGVFNDEHMNTIGSAFLLFLIGVIIMPLLGSLIAAFVIWPIEMTIRGLVRSIRTRGKEWQQFAMGLFGLVVLAFITTGFLAVHTYDTGQGGSAQALLAILGIPGHYEVKSEAMLWVARGLFVLFVGTALVGKYIFGDGAPKQQQVSKKKKRD